MEKKLRLLADIGRRLRHAGIDYAIGSSVLLYLHGLVDEFDDIELFVKGEDLPSTVCALADLGSITSRLKKAPYMSSGFYTLQSQDAEVDLIGDFGVMCDDMVGTIHVSRHSIEQETMVFGESVPLMYLEDWLEFYKLMGRERKVHILTQYFMKHRAAKRTGIIWVHVEQEDA